MERSLVHGIAGTTAGLVSTLVGHPLDVIKTRMQVKHRTQSPFQTVKDIITEEGLRGLFDGAGTNILASSINWGLFFALYNSLKGESKPSVPRHLFAATLGSAIVTITTNPLFVVKTRLQLNGKIYPSIWAGLKTIARNEGMAGLYSGLVPGLFGVTHGAVQFAVYEELKRLFASYAHSPSTRLGMTSHTHMRMNTGQQFLAGAVSKVIATSATYPYQVVRSRLQQEQNKAQTQESNDGEYVYVYSGTLDVVRKIAREEGWRGFYRGLGPQLVRVAPVAAVTFFTYERVGTLLRKFKL